MLFGMAGLCGSGVRASSEEVKFELAEVLLIVRLPFPWHGGSEWNCAREGSKQIEV